MAHLLPAAQCKQKCCFSLPRSYQSCPVPGSQGPQLCLWSLKRAHCLVFTLGAALRHLVPLEPAS